MKKLYIIILALGLVQLSCKKDDDGTKNISQGDYPVKEYYLERNPSVNPWGAAIHFVHAECKQAETLLDYEYLAENAQVAYDLKFYTVKAYFTDKNGDTKQEGCPAMLLGTGAKACQLGQGVSFFDSLIAITPEMLDALATEPEVDYEACKDTLGHYDRSLLFDAFSKCIIGNRFRANVLEIPDGAEEQDVQPVFLVESAEGGYAKFMVKQFKGDAPKEKQTLVRWQVISAE